MVCLFGQHVVKTSSHTQSTISLSSGESEYYALVKGGAVALGYASLLKDWGVNLGESPLVSSDSSAARAMSLRVGIGKVRHHDARNLWTQNAVQTMGLLVRKLTKRIWRHRRRKGRAIMSDQINDCYRHHP